MKKLADSAPDTWEKLAPHLLVFAKVLAIAILALVVERLIYVLLRTSYERRKAQGRDSMHLKSYLVDRRTLRTGSANFSYSGERFQDNDVVLLESPALAGAFARNFETIWARTDNREAAQ